MSMTMDSPSRTTVLAGRRPIGRRAPTRPVRRPERKDERATTPVSGSRDPEPPWNVG